MDEFKGKWSAAKQFEGIIKGNVDYNWYKNYENTDNSQDQKSHDQINSEINQKQIDNDKEVNIKIDNKDHTINININAKQKTIEDAWS